MKLHRTRSSILAVALGVASAASSVAAQARSTPTNSSAAPTARPRAPATTQPTAGAQTSPSLVLEPMRVVLRRNGTVHEPYEPYDDHDVDEPIVIEMFASPTVAPFAPPFALRPFGPPIRPLRLISSYDGDDGDDAPDPTPRVTVRVAPALSILREYDGDPPPPAEVRIECIVAAPDRTLVLLPMRVTGRTSP